MPQHRFDVTKGEITGEVDTPNYHGKQKLGYFKIMDDTTGAHAHVFLRGGNIGGLSLAYEDGHILPVLAQYETIAHALKNAGKIPDNWSKTKDLALAVQMEMGPQAAAIACQPFNRFRGGIYVHPITRQETDYSKDPRYHTGTGSILHGFAQFESFRHSVNKTSDTFASVRMQSDLYPNLPGIADGATIQYVFTLKLVPGKTTPQFSVTYIIDATKTTSAFPLSVAHHSDFSINGAAKNEHFIRAPLVRMYDADDKRHPTGKIGDIDPKYLPFIKGFTPLKDLDIDATFELGGPIQLINNQGFGVAVEGKKLKVTGQVDNYNTETATIWDGAGLDRIGLEWIIGRHARTLNIEQEMDLKPVIMHPGSKLEAEVTIAPLFHPI